MVDSKSTVFVRLTIPNHLYINVNLYKELYPYKKARDGSRRSRHNERICNSDVEVRCLRCNFRVDNLVSYIYRLVRRDVKYQPTMSRISGCLKTASENRETRTLDPRFKGVLRYQLRYILIVWS